MCRKNIYDEWPISMTLNGNYHILAKFFERIGKLYRIINVNDFTVKTLALTTSVSTTIPGHLCCNDLYI